jgi:hypothetical protein
MSKAEQRVEIEIKLLHVRLDNERGRCYVPVAGL